MLTTILLCWYSLGWAAVALWCKRMGTLTISDLGLCLVTSPVAVVILGNAWAGERFPGTRTLWKRDRSTMPIMPLEAAAQAYAKATGVDYEAHKAVLLENMRQAVEAYEGTSLPLRARDAAAGIEESVRFGLINAEPFSTDEVIRLAVAHFAGLLPIEPAPARTPTNDQPDLNAIVGVVRDELLQACLLDRYNCDDGARAIVESLRPYLRLTERESFSPTEEERKEAEAAMVRAAIDRPKCQPGVIGINGSRVRSLRKDMHAAFTILLERFQMRPK